MIRSLSLVLCVTFGLVGCGSNNPSGGSPAKSALDVAPGDKAVSGWEIDRAVNRNANGAPMTGATKEEVEGLIDGAATPFFIEPSKPSLFLWQNYFNETLASAQPDGGEISMYVLQMPSADQAKDLFKAVLSLSEYDRKKGTDEDWKVTSPLVGTESRIQDTGSTWWINFYQGIFYVEIVLSPSTSPPPDYKPGNLDTKAEAVRFAKEVAGRIGGNPL